MIQMTPSPFAAWCIERQIAGWSRWLGTGLYYRVIYHDNILVYVRSA